MPRRARLDADGLLQHVTVRGIEDRRIFEDDDDRQWFVVRLDVLLGETGVPCLAWALLPDRVLLLLRPPQGRLALLMRRLLTAYALYYNRRHGRAGHLFRNRYTSVVYEDDPYLAALAAHVHAAPLRAGLVRDCSALARYPWSGHAAVAGAAGLAHQDVDALRACFGHDREHALQGYRAAVAREGAFDPQSGSDRPAWHGSIRLQGSSSGDTVTDSRAMGSRMFVEHLLGLERRRTRPALDFEIAQVVERAARQFNVPAGHLRSSRRTRPVAAARALVCYCAVRVLGCNGAAVGRYLHMSRSAVCLAARRGEEEAARRPELVEQLTIRAHDQDNFPETEGPGENNP